MNNSSTPIGEKLSTHSDTWTDNQIAKKAGVGIGSVARYNKIMNSNDEDLKEKVKAMNLTFQAEEGEIVVRPRGTDNAKVIQVIETTALRCEGTEKDKCREVKQYWDLDRKLLAKNEPCAKEKE